MSSRKQIGLLLRAGSDRQLLEQFLHGHGHSTVVVEDGRELQAAAGLALLFVDERSARTFQADLVGLKGRRHLVPVMLVVRGTGSPLAVRMLEEGLVNDVLRMPVAKPELTHRLDVLLRLSDQSRSALVRFERLFEDASWGVTVLDASGRNIQVANAAFARMHGYTPAELERRPLQDLLAGDCASTLEDKLRLLHETGALVFECEHLHRAGHTFPAEIDATVYRDENGQAAYIAAYVRDITERKTFAQELLCRNEQLREAVKAKADFLANITHEMRTPLHGALATLSLLKTTRLSPLQSDYVQLVESSSQSLVSLVNDVLDYSTLASGELVLEQLPFRLAPLFHSVLEMFQSEIRAKDLTVGVHLDNLPASVIGDAHRVRQLLFNLLSNAVKFTDSGTIQLDARMLPNGELQCQVTDTGVGVELLRQNEIFNVFRQLDESTTRRWGGTGLGLALCHRLVALMGGQLTMTSTKGLGSQFTFSVPLQGVEGEPLESFQVRALPRPLVAPTGGSSLSVLVVEDNPINQRIMTLLLNQLGHRAVVAADGLEGVNKFAGENFDLVVMDLQMPHLSGLEATAIIRTLEKNDGRARAPVVALTARVIAGDRQTCEQAGMDGFYTKPLTLCQLADVLSRWVQQPTRSAVNSEK